MRDLASCRIHVAPWSYGRHDSRQLPLGLRYSRMELVSSA